jgi:hypothetical protein
MINAPNFIVGYGLIIPAMMISLIFFKPWRGVLLFFSAHLIASLILIISRSAFTEIAIVSLIARSILVAILSYAYIKGKLSKPYEMMLTVVALDTIIAYTIGLSYFGHDAIEVGLDIYSLTYIPFVYIAHRHFLKGRYMYTAAAIAIMLLFYFSAAYFISLYTFIWSILLIAILYTEISIEKISRGISLSLILITLLLVYLSLPSFYYNLYASTYPFHNRLTTMGDGIYSYEALDRDVWSIERLRIMENQVTVRGYVATHYSKAEDGDIYFDLELDPEYSYMLSIGSIILRKGRIHIEIVPADQDYVSPPPIGAYVEITGTWTVDTDHGSWSEIHPARDIKILEE